MSKPSMSVKDKVRAFRQACVIQSLGWEGARAYFATLTPKEKEDYFPPKPKP